MQFIRQNKKVSIIVLVCLSLLLLFGFTYAKYVYNMIDNYILETKGFYFNSSVMNINGKNHSINNWDGVNSYTLLIVRKMLIGTLLLMLIMILLVYVLILLDVI